MAKLYELAKLIRSKNAGPFHLTFDVMFEGAEAYHRVVVADVLTKEWFAQTYRVAVEDIQLTLYEPGLAIKATFPRPVSAGDVGDNDVLGGQQYFPVEDLEIP